MATGAGGGKMISFGTGGSGAARRIGASAAGSGSLSASSKPGSSRVSASIISCCQTKGNLGFVRSEQSMQH